MKRNNVEKRAQLVSYFNSRLTQIVLADTQEIDLRSAATLTLAKALKPKETLEETVFSEINATHRVTLPDGPLACYYSDTSRKTRLFSRVSDLLLHSDALIRRCALEHFEKQGAMSVGSKSRSAMTHWRHALLSNNGQEWRTAGIQLFDVIEDDFICNLAGTSQSATMRYNEGFSHYFDKVLHPTNSALRPIFDTVLSPTKDREIIRKLIFECANQDTLPEVCSSYLEKLGYLPLCSDLSLGSAISAWNSAHEKPAALFDVVLDWASKLESPLAKYHAVYALLNFDDLTPTAKLESLFEHALDICDDCSSEDSGTAWKLRFALSRLYLFTLECRFPGHDGEFLASTSWWLAERVSRLFGNDDTQLNRLLAGVVHPQKEKAEALWHITYPLVRPSALRFMTMFDESCWASSIRVSLLRKIADPPSVSPQIRSRLHRETLKTFGCPVHTGAAGEDFAFYRAETFTAEGNLSEVNQDFRKYLEACTKIETPKGAIEMLQQISSSDLGSNGFDLILMQRVLLLSFIGELPAAFETLLATSEWRRDFFLKLSDFSLDMLFLAIINSQFRLERKPIIYRIPHYFSEACELDSVTPERRQALFGLCFMSSIALNSTSALQRLLSGNNRESYATMTEEWKTRMQNMQPSAPEWISGRLGSILCALRDLT